MITPQSIKRIPYAISDYHRLRTDNAYYVDKTHFIPLIEAAPYYLFCIRPRRFGKSLWLSLLQHYYDVNHKDEFDFLFGDTYIGQHPTPERNSYLVMVLSFALVNPDVRYVQASFEDNCQAEIESFLRRYRRFFDEAACQDILAQANTEARLRRIFYYVEETGLKLYLLIDEYDNFANTILTTEGQEAYHQLTHGGGFMRHFFNFLKGGTGVQMSGLSRLYITGVSPITMDDVTSGFNIGTNISLDARFNEMIGFTETEVKAMLTYYHEVGRLKLDVEACFALMQMWYNNYRFSKEVETYLFNSDMTLYFLEQAQDRTTLPQNLIDQNIRIDYEKLRHLLTVDKQLNGNFSQLREIIETGETVSDINVSFPLDQLLNRENFISLLLYFGLLTFAGEHEGEPLLRIPNRTVKDLMYSYLRDGFRDVDAFRLDLRHFGRLLRGLAYRGEWQAVFDFLAAEIQQQTSIRDYLKGEKVIQGFLLAYLNVSHFFLTWSEREMGNGFVDLYLEPFLARYTDMKYGYLIELKYITRGEFSQDKLQEKIEKAEHQLQQYANDVRIQAVAQQVTLKKLIVIFNGWELVYREERA